MRIASTIGATEVAHAGENYTADDDGIFDVPEPVGLELTGFPAWLPEHEADARHADEQAAADADPVRQAARIAELEAQVQALDERLAALEPANEPATEKPLTAAQKKAAEKAVAEEAAK